VRLSTTADIVWVASTALPDSVTTNNKAEFEGLCTGLEAAAAHRFLPITVIGDSQLILNFMKSSRQPKAAHLRQHYHRAKAAAARTMASGWIHHFRTANRMADRAANIAMDSNRSYCGLPSDDPLFEPLHQLLRQDIDPWLRALDGSEFSASADHGQRHPPTTGSTVVGGGGVGTGPRPDD
jgi:ribonuclease HI